MRPEIFLTKNSPKRLGIGKTHFSPDEVTPYLTTPHWLPDEVVNSCYLCDREFSFLLRKHHCRCCGKIYCDDCSSSRIEIKKLGYTTPVRTCDICVQDSTLNETGTTTALAGVLPVEIIAQWTRLCSSESTEELHKKAVLGIPDALRPVVWASLTDTVEIINKNTGLYDLYASRPNEIVDPPISLDLPRTFPYHPKFGKDGTHIQALRNVLVAYANFNPALGYCQGMSFIAAMLLMHLEEEHAFWVFVQIIKAYHMDSFFSDSHERPNIYLAKFRKNIEAKAPALVLHMENEGCDPQIFAVQWLRTLFALDFDISRVFRLWDIFFVRNLDFLVHFAVAIFVFGQAEIMALHHADMMMYVKKKIPFFVATNFEPILLMALNSVALETAEAPPTQITRIPPEPTPTDVRPTTPRIPDPTPTPNNTPAPQRNVPRPAPLSKPTPPTTAALSTPPTPTPPPLPPPTTPPQYSPRFHTSGQQRTPERRISSSNTTKRRSIEKDTESVSNTVLDVPPRSPRDFPPDIDPNARRVRLVELNSMNIVTEITTRLALQVNLKLVKPKEAFPSWW